MNGGDSNQQQQQQRQMQQQQWVAMQQYQQWWMAVQYPAMVMQQQQQQQQMMYNQQYLPFYHQQQQPKQHTPKHRSQIQASGEDNKTIWIGDLRHWMDEDYLHSCFSQSGEVFSVKIIRNRQTGLSERYGFIEFNSHDAAESALQSYNGTIMPNAEQPFRLNWAGFSAAASDRRPETSSDLSIFVGDLAADVTDELLRETFASRYPSVKDVKVVVDPNTGCSKGYGFVRFSDENEKSKAVTEMNGVLCSSRPMRIGVATPKKYSSHQHYSPQGQSENESSSTTIFVGGLDSEVTDDKLKESFIPFGEIVSVKIPVGKGCGFVQFAKRNNAEDAIHRLNGEVIGKQKVRLSWGRTLNNKQSRGDHHNQWNGDHYYIRQGYYGYNNGGTGYWNGGRSREQSVS